jgi:hypothetical protein
MVVIGNDFQVALVNDYAAIGSGAAHALGALGVTEHMSPEPRLELALEIATKHNAGVRPPYHIYST